MESLFGLGKLLATPGALSALSSTEIQRALARHLSGDWGQVGRDDWQENDRSLEESRRLFSVYAAQSGQVFWVITEADRSATTILLPEEY